MKIPRALPIGSWSFGKPGRWATLVACALMVYVFFAAWKASAHRMDSVLDPNSDQWGYYHYLPALIGTHDYAQLPWSVHLENGRALSIFNSGVAFLQAPFFGLACIAAQVGGYPVDGYSEPFVFGQFAASAFYLAVGCLLLFHALRRTHPLRVAAAVPLLLFGATNLYFYAVFDVGMSHVYAFFLLAWLHYLTVRMVEAPRPDRLVGLFVVAALITLVRPLNAIALLFPLLYGPSVQQAFRERLRWVRSYPLPLVIGVLLAILLWVPQLIYWHFITGDWLVFTYGTNDQGFNWLTPHLADVLVSHQNGWFIYSPLMAMVMGVLLWNAWRGVPNARLVLVIWALIWYAYASWWCWWLGGSFGHRGFIEYYAFLSLPLAWWLDRLFRMARWKREAIFVLLILLVYINVRMSRLYQWPWEGPDWSWQKLGDVFVMALAG